MYPVVLGFYGKSDTGKTSLIVKLMGRLRAEGYTVASIKQTDKKIGVDQKDTDTWRHSKAGARLVVFSSPSETDYLMKEPQDPQTIFNNISTFGTYDVILIEGASDQGIDKIRLGDIKKRDNTLCNYQGDFEKLVGLVKKKIDERGVTPNKQHIDVKVNGKKVPLSPFPSVFIQNTIVGMLKSLKGVDCISEVEIHIIVDREHIV